MIPKEDAEKQPGTITQETLGAKPFVFHTAGLGARVFVSGFIGPRGDLWLGVLVESRVYRASGLGVFSLWGFG